MATSLLNPGASSPLYLQLQRQLRTMIQQGEWRPGMRLPAVPQLAERFSVHRLTVLKAIAGLKRTGWVQTVQGRGSFVADRLPEAPGLRPESAFPFEGSPLLAPEGELGSWLGETLERAQDSHLISFSAGFIPSDLLPVAALKKAYAQALKELGAEAFVYAAPGGHAPYLQAVASWLESEGEPLREGWGIRALPGAQAGLALIVEALTVPGDKILVESPCYVGALALIRALGREAVPVPVDRHGLDPDRLASALQRVDAKLLFTVPSFQNPTGMTLSTQRRERVLALARAHGVTVITDSAYGDLRFSGKSLPPFRCLDDAEHVIHLGTFSKSLAAGLRLGYLIATDEMLRRLGPIQEVQQIALPTLDQAAVARFLSSGDFRRHLVRLRRALKERRDAMVEALRAHFPSDVEFTEPKGGMHLWVVLPEGLSAIELHREALREGLGFAPGPLFFADRRGTNCLRLNFSSHAPEVTRDAMARLGRLVHRLRSTTPRRSAS